MEDFSKKLSAVQTELRAPKGQTNKFGGYKYRSCEDILEAVKPLLHKHELCLFISDEIVGVEGRVYVKATAKITDGKGEVQVTASAREEENKKGMDGAQITGAASSYARKYALNGLFCIDDTKDSDATNNHGNSAPRSYPKPAQAPAKTPPPPKAPAKKKTTTQVFEEAKVYLEHALNKTKSYEDIVKKYGETFTAAQLKQLTELAKS